MRVAFWIIAAIAGTLVAILGNELGKNIIYPLSRRGRPPARRSKLIWVIFFISLLASIIFGALAAFAPATPTNFNHILTETSIPASVTLFSPILTNSPSTTLTDMFTPAFVLTPTAPPTLPFHDNTATMVFIPAGEFMMGSNNAEDEKPIHKVYLDAFWIDKTEVTNSMYDRCVRAGQCNPPQFNRSAKRDYYYGNPEFDHYPVILVSWDDASTYCAWANRRLPTEAEWEKAARGIDGRIYPWGGIGPSNIFLNYNGQANVGDTTEAGAYPDGVSPYGTLDMAGNVWEWVADWYGPNYYGASPTANPIGPAIGEYHVLRGGSWFSPEDHITVTTRETKGSSFRDDIIGFRCAKSEA